MGKRDAGKGARSGTHDQLFGICHSNYYQDLSARRLIYTSPERIEEAGGSMLRVLKFYQKGFRIPLKDLAAVIARISCSINPSKVDIENESHVAPIITALLREVDPEVDPEHRAHLPSIDQIES